MTSFIFVCSLYTHEQMNKRRKANSIQFALATQHNSAHALGNLSSRIPLYSPFSFALDGGGSINHLPDTSDLVSTLSFSLLHLASGSQMHPAPAAEP